MLLLLTFEQDAHGDQLVYELDQLGFHDYLRIDAGRLVERVHLSSGLVDGRWRWSVSMAGAPGLQLDSEQLRTVWYHRLAHPGLGPRLQAPGAGDLDASQACCAFRWMIQKLPPSRFPLGHPSNIAVAENKFLQLETASACGLAVLPTVYSTDPRALLDFVREHGEVAVKGIGPQSVVSEDGDSLSILGAKVFSADELVPHLEHIDQTQLYLQKAVKKVAEHRITVLPEEVIDCRIDTSELPPGEVDYRPHFGRLSHRLVPCSPGLEDRLRAYLNQMGLVAGCFDFAELEDGSLVFFECNPIGEWFGIERLTGHPISRMIALALVDHHQAEPVPGRGAG